jgi:hypothetical protein
MGAIIIWRSVISWPSGFKTFWRVGSGQYFREERDSPGCNYHRALNYSAEIVLYVCTMFQGSEPTPNS